MHATGGLLALLLAAWSGACGDDASMEPHGDASALGGRDGQQGEGQSGRHDGGARDASLSDSGSSAATDGSVPDASGDASADAAVDAGGGAGDGGGAGGSGGAGGGGTGGGGGADGGPACPSAARCHTCAELTDPELRACRAAGWGGACLDHLTDAAHDCVCQACADACDDGGECLPFLGAAGDACATCVQAERVGACALAFDACVAGPACPASAAVPSAVTCATSDLEGSSRSCRVLLSDCEDAVLRTIECDYDAEGAYDCECIGGDVCARAFSIAVSRNTGSFCFDAWPTLLAECGVSL